METFKEFVETLDNSELPSLYKLVSKYDNFKNNKLIEKYKDIIDG